MAPPFPNTMCRPRAIGLAFAVIGLLVWRGENRGIEKQRGGQGLGLRWLPFGQKTQQSTESRRKRKGDDIGEAGGGGSAGGYTVQSFGAANEMTKK